MAEYYLNKLDLPNDIKYSIYQYLPSYKYMNDIKKNKYNNIWFKRLVCRNILSLKKNEISYFDWYKIFHKKDYNQLIKYENKKLLKLLEDNDWDEINKIHINNIKDANKKNYMNYSIKNI